MQYSEAVLADARATITAAKRARARGDLSAAMDLYRQAAAQVPNKKSMVYVVADGLRDCGNRTEALTFLEKASQRWPDNVGMLSRLSQAYLEHGDYSRAAICMRRFLDRTEQPTAAHWRQMAALHMRAEEFEKAEYALDQVLSAEPLDAQASLGRGNALWQQGRIEEALEAFRRAERIEPANALVLFRLGLAVLETGAPLEAAQYLQRSLQADSQNLEVCSYLSLALSRGGHYGAAAEAARAALQADPKSVAANQALGMALLGTGDFDGAAASLKFAAGSAPTKIGVLLALADAETARGQPFAAEMALQQVLALEPGNASVRFALAALNGEALLTTPAEFVRETFDQAAESYDALHGDPNKYSLPAAAAALLEDALPDQSEFRRFADLGCGTGIVASAIRDAFRIEHATGVDLSVKMIEVATRKDLYDRLIAGDAVLTLDALKEHFDLITALELAPYIGNLSELTRAVAESLTEGGMFVCSIEHAQHAPYALKKTRRFAHQVDYLKDQARTSGLEFLEGRTLSLPPRLGVQAQGMLLLFRRIDA